jgi:predicted dithiol-disulfide oxidoreductase (DUF899 family)
MSYSESLAQIRELRGQILALRQQIREVQVAVEPEKVDDYEFAAPDGPVKLSALFGDRDALIVIHNMGAQCSYCSLWADGFNGLVDQLESRAAFVVSSPDTPQAQAALARKRGWRFPMVSLAGNSFAADMGFASERGFEPGVSVFNKVDGQVVRVSDANLGPGDDYCAIWHLFDLLPEGAAGWQPLE